MYAHDIVLYRGVDNISLQGDIGKVQDDINKIVM